MQFKLCLSYFKNSTGKLQVSSFHFFQKTATLELQTTRVNKNVKNGIKNWNHRTTEYWHIKQERTAYIFGNLVCKYFESIKQPSTRRNKQWIMKTRIIPKPKYILMAVITYEYPKIISLTERVAKEW